MSCILPNGTLTDAVPFIRSICGTVHTTIAALTEFDTITMIALPLVRAACFKTTEIC